MIILKSLALIFPVVSQANLHSWMRELEVLGNMQNLQNKLSLRLVGFWTKNIEIIAHFIYALLHRNSTKVKLMKSQLHESILKSQHNEKWPALCVLWCFVCKSYRSASFGATRTTI
jgi:hypothetical protein